MLFRVPTRPAWAQRLPALTLLPMLLAALLAPGAPNAAAAAPTPPPAAFTAPATPDAGCVLSFTDLPESSPFYLFVQRLVCHNVVGGYSDNTFRPGANVTRGQLAKFVSNAAGYADTVPADHQTFADVPPSDPFWLFIERAATHGVVGGYSDGTFRPGSNVTRGQVAKFVSNAAGYTATITATQQTFADVPSSNPFWQFVERAAAQGVVGGYTCGAAPAGPCDGQQRPYFLASNAVTRGQTAKFIANAFFLPSAQDLIATAYQAGQLDYPTALLYRAYAQFGDSRLPAAYQGGGSAGDATLFPEIAASRATLPAATLAQLQPFLVRPDNAASIFSAPDAPASPAEPGAAPAVGCEATGWAHAQSTNPQHPVRVWARCNRPQDTGYDLAINTTLGILDQIWDPMTTLMGAPKPDDGGGGSPATDFYIVNMNDHVVRNGRVNTLGDTPDADGATIVSPDGATQTGALVLLSRAEATQPHYHSLVIHEFFHVLQNAHNAPVSFRNSGTAAHPVWDEFWFTEASASWAESYYDRTLAWPQRAAGTYVYASFDTFQENMASLHASTPNFHKYAAFIWPYFMEQESGSPAKMAAAWHALESVSAGDFDGAMQALDSTFSFADHFSDFAVRNLNKEFDGQNPIGTHYQDLDHLFPEGKMPRPDLADTLMWAMDPAYPGNQVGVAILPLQAAYYHYTVLAGIKQVRLDFSALAPQTALKARAVVKVRGADGAPAHWELRDLSTTQENTLCNVDDIWLVLSNAAISYDAAQAITHSFRLRALAAPCTCDWAGEVTTGWHSTLTSDWHTSASGPLYGAQVSASVARSVQVDATMTDSQPGATLTDISWFASVVLNNLGGSGTVNDTSTSIYPIGTTTYFNRGSGAPDLVSVAAISLHTATCTYDISAALSVPTTTSTGEQTSTGVGSFYIFDIPLPPTGGSQVLSGQRTLPVVFAASGTRFYAGMDDVSTDVQAIRGNLGNATITWSFEPLPQP